MTKNHGTPVQEDRLWVCTMNLETKTIVTLKDVFPGPSDVVVRQKAYICPGFRLRIELLFHWITVPIWYSLCCTIGTVLISS